MLLFDGTQSRYSMNVAEPVRARRAYGRRLQRYIPLSVAYQTLRVCDLLPDVETFIPDIAHSTSTTNKPIRPLRLISAISSQRVRGVSSGGLS